MKVFGIIGFSGSGKTTIAEHIISELVRRGYSVGAVKNSHHAIQLDMQGTNTDRLSRAGALVVAARGQAQTHLIFAQSMAQDKLLDYFEQDYVIIEGEGGMDVPTIITAHDAQGIDAKLNAHAFAVSGVIAAQLGTYKGLPVICGISQTKQLVDIIEENAEERRPRL